MYFRPRLSDGRLAPLTWQIRLFFLNVNWPLEDDSTWIRRNLDKFLVIVVFIMFLMCNSAELSFIIFNIQDIDIVMEALGVYLLQLELNFRLYNMALRKPAFKKFLQEFYSKIYIERDYNVMMYRLITRNMLPTELYSYSYIGTLLVYFSVTIVGLYANLRLLPFKMLFPFDITQLQFYIPTLTLNILMGVIVVGCLIAESNLLATAILHLNGRYLLLQKDCENLHGSLLRSVPSDRFLCEFRQGLMRIIQRNVELNEFAAKLQSEYSFRVFIMMSMSSILLCVLGFMSVTIGIDSRNIRYFPWFTAKILELLVFGQVGSKLISTTNELSSMYYMSNWENVILQSSNSSEITQLMKLIALAIEMNQNPISVTGFNFFSVSLTTVLSILQGSFSYFSCLYALR